LRDPYQQAQNCCHGNCYKGRRKIQKPGWLTELF
jgi:hypothetical protein